MVLGVLGLGGPRAPLGPGGPQRGPNSGIFGAPAEAPMLRDGVFLGPQSDRPGKAGKGPKPGPKGAPNPVTSR